MSKLYVILYRNSFGFLIKMAGGLEYDNYNRALGEAERLRQELRTTTYVFEHVGTCSEKIEPGSNQQ